MANRVDAAWNRTGYVELFVRCDCGHYFSAVGNLPTCGMCGRRYELNIRAILVNRHAPQRIEGKG